MSNPTPTLPPPTDAELLRRAAERVLDQPGWLGHALARAAAAEGIGTVAAVAAGLRDGPPPTGLELSRLMLCRTPAGPALPRQAAEIADEFGLDRARLIALLRRLQALDAGAAPATLLAARRDDAVDDDAESQPEGGDA